MIRGRPYHPQTQGLIERANQTFKRRLRAIQRERGFPASHWVELLPELALIINTTTTRTLPGKKTPFEVWFGRKPRWMRADYLGEEPVGVNDDLLHVDNEEFGDDPVLSEIERRVAEHNRRTQAQMVKQSRAHGVITEFEDGDIATLLIPPKMRLKTESKRLPVRILLGDHGQYKVMSRHGRISGRWPAEELNTVGDDLIELLGGNIPMEAEYKAGKEVQIQLTKAVALENNRGSITAAQKAGRATKTTGLGSRDSDSESDSPPTRQSNQTPLHQGDVQNLTPRLRPRRQLFTQSQSSPIRQPQSRAAPDLPAAAAPEPVKKTRKRKALEDHGEVDMGPRKLRSMK
jgi:hypothetical protein